VANGKARGLHRYLCKACGRTFGALTGTRLSGLHRKEDWLTFGACLAEGDTIKTSSERCGVAVSTAFRWRHRFLEAVQTGAEKLRGIVEADETFVLSSRKGSRAWKTGKQGDMPADPPDRKPRKRGGKAAKRGLSHELVPVLVRLQQRRLHHVGGVEFGPQPAVNLEPGEQPQVFRVPFQRPGVGVRGHRVSSPATRCRAAADAARRVKKS